MMSNEFSVGMVCVSGHWQAGRTETQTMSDLILIVEDNQTNYELLANLLRSQGYEVAHAADGARGLELMIELQPALLVLDLRLPRLDGWSVAQQVREHPIISSVPIIAVSVMVQADDVERAYAAGCDAYVEKPFKVREFLQILHQFVR